MKAMFSQGQFGTWMRAMERVVTSSRLCWKACALGLLGCWLASPGMLVGRCLAQDASLDRVDIVQRTTGQQQTISGRVIDYNGRFLTLERVGGQQEQIASSRVRKVKTSRTRQHIRADQLLAEHQFEQALTAYQQAVKEETRQWVRQEILAQWVWCYQSLGLVEQAGDAFLKLVLASDPQTLYFQAIPLNWGKQTVTPALEGQAQVWLTGSSSAASRLMGASWLLGTSQRSLAIDVLKQLATQEDIRIALLAESQLWRTQQATVSLQGLNQWEQQLARLPVKLRAGPYYLLATGFSRHQEQDRAIVSWMRVPINYPRHFHLSSESLLGAARELDRLKRAPQARNVYQEIVRRYSNTIAAGQAQRWLTQQDRSESPSPKKPGTAN